VVIEKSHIFRTRDFLNAWQCIQQLQYFFSVGEVPARKLSQYERMNSNGFIEQKTRKNSIAIPEMINPY